MENFPTAISLINGFVHITIFTILLLWARLYLKLIVCSSFLCFLLIS